MSVEKSVYNLGCVYAVAEHALPDVLGRPEKKTACSAAPMKYLAEIINTLISNNALSDTIDKKLSFLLDDVDPNTPENIPIDIQGAWWTGYYSGKNNPDDLISLANKPTGIGARIKKLRMERGLTQAEFGAKLGVLQKDVSRWESGKIEPKPETLQRMSEIFEAPVTP